MDQILRGILKSTQSYAVKKTFLERVALAANDHQGVTITNDVFIGVLNASSEAILNSTNKNERKLCQEIYVSWINSHSDKLYLFLTPTVVQYWLDNQFTEPFYVIWLLDQSMNIYRSQNFNINIPRIIEQKILAFLERNSMDYQTVVELSRFLTEHRTCIPKGRDTALFCSLMIHAVSFFTAPVENISKYIQDVSYTIGPLLGHIWGNCDNQTILRCLENAFLLMSSKKDQDSNPSYALAGVMQYMPNHMIDKVMEVVVSDPNTNDESLSTALLRMSDWLSWPATKNAHLWIMSFLRHLASAHKFSIVLDVAETVIDKLFLKIQYPVIRDRIFDAVRCFLLNFRYSAELFHKVIPHCSTVFGELQKENLDSSRKFCLQLVELLHCLMHAYPGFPDLYEPLLVLIKDYPVPSADHIRKILTETLWTPSYSNVSFCSKFWHKSSLNKTGLLNLGNTCYMNSVLQALFMCLEFRNTVLTCKPSSSQPLLTSIQSLFAFLLHSQRASYSPLSFLAVSRPSWFVPNQQQDSSEYLTFVLDRLHEEAKKQKTSNHVELASFVQQLFHGKMMVTSRCLRCGLESNVIETFANVPLAFPNCVETCGKNGAAKENNRGYTGTLSNKNGLATNNCGYGLATNNEGNGDGALHLKDMVKYFLRKEVLEGSNQYECSNCASLQNGEREIRFIQLPNYLVVTLLRFSYDPISQTRSKLLTDVNFPEEISLPVVEQLMPHSSERSPSSHSTSLSPTFVKQIVPALGKQISPTSSPSKLSSSNLANMQQFFPSSSKTTSPVASPSSPGRQALTSSPRSSRNSPASVKENLSLLRSEQYVLVATTFHSGISLDSGHYYSYARTVSQSASNNDTWFLFNDSRVSQTQFSTFSKTTQRFRHDTPYLLIYQKVHSSFNNSTDVTLSKELLRKIEEDNRLFVLELENAERNRQQREKQTSYSKSYSKWDKDDRGPTGGCGGGGFSSVHNGPPVIF